MRGLTGPIVAALALTVLSGCASSAADAPLNEDNGAVTYQVGSLRSGDSAAFSGVLVFEDGCVRFENGTIPIFPADETSWDGEELVFDGVTYRMGDTLEVGGGQGSRDTTTADVPARCGDGTLWGVAPSAKAP